MDEWQKWFSRLPDFIWNMLLFVVALCIGFLTRISIQAILKVQAKKTETFSFGRSLPRRLARPLSVFLPFMALYLLLPEMAMGPKSMLVLHKFVYIAFLISFAYLLFGILRIAEDYVYYTFDIKKTDNLRERKIRTQLQFVRRLVMIIIILVTLCFIFMSFESLRRIGTGLLTGVGVGGIIIGFAAQKSLANFLAGFQIAFTQPLRIDDVLIVEGEWGRVEEITLTYVVLRIWDLRALVIPINYFIEKPFQNWTRSGADIIGTVFLYLDYSVPTDAIRAELDRLLAQTPLWNQRTKVVQITDCRERVVEVRALVSANSSSAAFDLRCFIREGLLEFIRKSYPDALPVTRVELSPPAPPEEAKR